MTKYEYKTVSFDHIPRFRSKKRLEQRDKELNQLGAEGWKLISVHTQAWTGDHIHTFLREIHE
ncbi:DUF4177 domain-containing protein [Jeotgalibacillus marinus]|uniref:DUF4177 domain-containing protein n=1 Tax=Jeotgalibacillus marinus TaxID=86667 RepID=A0ABV3Q5Q5_9BACL